jgi:hypothetical protein
MTVYNVVLFVHITLVIVIFVGLTADGLAIGGLRTTDSAEPSSGSSAGQRSSFSVSH